MCFFPEREPKIGQSLEESLRWEKIVKNIDIFWMNNKTIIEFGFRMMWRIMQISEDVIFTSYSASFINCYIYIYL